MIYIAVIAVVEAVVIAYFVWAMLELNGRAVEERRELEDRLMSMCASIPLTQVQVARTEHQGRVTYVDEELSTARGQSNGVAET
jgi:hypothetical protein